MSPPTERPTTGALRLVRALVLGAVAMTLGAGAHTIGGGALPGLPVLMLLSIPVGLLTVAVTARRVSRPALVGVLGLVQAGLHVALGQMAPMGHCAPVAAASGHAGHQPGSLAGACTGVAESAAMPMSLSGSMVLAHVVATLLTALILSRGEALLWRVIRAIAARVPAAPAALPRRVRATIAGSVLRMRGRVAAGSARPRAPPLTACA